MSRTKRYSYNGIIVILSNIIGIVVLLKFTPLYYNQLGEGYFSANQLITQTIGYLNLAELGVGSSILAFLYKAKDKEEAEEILSVAKKMYSSIGITIIILSFFLSFTLKYLLKYENLNIFIIRTAFFLTGLNSAVTYFFNVPQFYAVAMQEGYKITKYLVILPFLSKLIGLLLLRHDFGLLSIPISLLIFSIPANVIVYYIQKRRYSLHFNNNYVSKYKKQILEKTRYVFVDRITYLGVFNTDYIIISIMDSVHSVASYSFYNRSFSIIRLFLSTLLLEAQHAIGEIIAIKDFNKLEENRKKLTSIFVFLTLPIIITTYIFFDNFLSLWISSDVIVGNLMKFCFSLNILYLIHIQTIPMILNADGRFKEKIPVNIAEFLLNILLSFFLIKKNGIQGVILATTIAHHLTSFIFLPIIYKKMNEKFCIIKYYLHYIIIVLIFLILIYLSGLFKIQVSESFLQLTLRSGVFFIITIVLTTIIGFFDKPFRMFIIEKLFLKLKRI